MTEQLDLRISQLRDLLEPLRRSARDEAREASHAWQQDSRGIIAAALGCSTSELAELSGYRDLDGEPEAELPAEEWSVTEDSSVGVLLPLGLLRADSRPEWLEITRYRRPRTPLHVWKLERMHTADDKPASMIPQLEASFGWYQAELTSQTVAIACQKTPTGRHYDVSYGRVTWTKTGRRAGVAHSDSERLVERLEELTQMLAEDRPQYRLQVRKEVWSLDEDMHVDRWGYRILDATGGVTEAASLSYSDMTQPDQERWFETRTAAARAGHEKIRSLTGSHRESGWEDVEKR
ncbi:MAG TPA: hypothetical protein VIJ15_12070 [Dermatophilaceae bacterium]